MKTVGTTDAVRRMMIDFLVEDTPNPENPMLWPEHGLSLLLSIELAEGNEEIRILFDTGSSGGALTHNLRLMESSLDETDFIVLSHGHYDHTGGLREAVKTIGRPIPIVLHPDAAGTKYALKPRLRYTGMPHAVSEIEKLGGRFLYNRRPLEVADGIFVTGEIPRRTRFEDTPEDYVILREEGLIRDRMLDDQALVACSEKGVIVVTGCAHSGIINTVRYAREITGIQRVYAVVGGFHLIDASEDRIRETVEKLVEIDPELIAPCHCTGDAAIERIEREFGEKLVRVNVGSRLIL